MQDLGKFFDFSVQIGRLLILSNLSTIHNFIVSTVLCWTEQDSGLLISSVYSCYMYWQEEGEKWAGVAVGKGS
jgi:hypothetical protein